jgi:hypothetical protein
MPSSLLDRKRALSPRSRRYIKAKRVIIQENTNTTLVDVQALLILDTASALHMTAGRVADDRIAAASSMRTKHPTQTHSNHTHAKKTSLRRCSAITTTK